LAGQVPGPRSVSDRRYEWLDALNLAAAPKIRR
jgi:hypothetical protein